MSLRLPRYTLFTDKTLREHNANPKRFADDVAETERANSEWDTDGGYAKLIHECRAAAAGDENRAEEILFERLAHMAAARWIKNLEEEEQEEEEWRRAEEVEKKRKRKMKAAAAEEDEEEEGRKQRKKQKQSKYRGGPPAAAAALIKNGRVDFSAIGMEPPPREFGEWIKRRHPGVGEVKLVIMKGLFETDLSVGHNRLSVPAKQIVDADFLTAEEAALLNEKRGEGIGVKLYGPGEGAGYTEMVLKNWELKKSNSYVLNKGWMSLVRRFPEVFQRMAIVQLWSFREAAGELAFRITKVGQLPNDRASGSGSGSGSGVKSEPGSGSDGGSDSDGGGGGLDLEYELEEGEVRPERGRPRVWRGSCPPRL